VVAFGHGRGNGWNRPGWRATSDRRVGTPRTSGASDNRRHGAEPLLARRRGLRRHRANQPSPRVAVATPYRCAVRSRGLGSACDGHVGPPTLGRRWRTAAPVPAAVQPRSPEARVSGRSTRPATRPERHRRTPNAERRTPIACSRSVAPLLRGRSWSSAPGPRRRRAIDSSPPPGPCGASAPRAGRRGGHGTRRGPPRRDLRGRCRRAAGRAA